MLLIRIATRALVAASDAPRRAAPAAQPGTVPSVIVRVLVVDKSDSARAGLVDLLARRQSLEVVAAVATADRAVEAITDVAPDLVLIDLHHGDLDGPAICAALRRVTRVPLVLLVTFMMRERWILLKAAGASEFLLKQVDAAALERDLVSFAREDRKRIENSGKTLLPESQGGDNA